MNDMTIIDTHCHIASLDFIPPSFVEGLAANAQLAIEAQGVPSSRDKIYQMFLTRFQDQYCDELVAEMDAAGIERSVLLAADFTYAVKDTRMSVDAMLAHHKTVMDRHPGRFSVFAGVDPRWGDDGLALFERSIRDDGFHGFKVYPPCGFSPGDRSLYPYYEICAAWRIPVLLHIGGTCPDLAFDTTSPVLLDQAARDFPGVDFILAHGSVSFIEECAMMAGFRPNVFIDVSGYQTADMSVLVQLFKRNFNHKVLFGTDWPFFRLQGTQKACIDKLRADDGPMSGLRVHEERSFLGGNLERLLAKRAAPGASSPEPEQREHVA